MLLLFMSGMYQSAQTTVYICKGSKGKKYHLKVDCRGLRNCQHQIVKMTLAEARNSGRTLCGWEK